MNAQLQLSKSAPETVLNNPYDCRLPALFEIVLVLVRFDHVARYIVNANQGVM
jgi:hypothetical protein